jgi:hypothetical protein
VVEESGSKPVQIEAKSLAGDSHSFDSLGQNEMGIASIVYTRMFVLAFRTSSQDEAGVIFTFSALPGDNP